MDGMGSRIGIVGLGTIGTQEFRLWERAGHTTVGYDVSPDAVQSLQAALGPDEAPVDRPQSIVTGNFSELAGCDVWVLCLPNLNAHGEIGMGAFDSFLSDALASPPRERLIIVASTVPIGFCRALAEGLGPAGRLLAHSPERYDPGRSAGLAEIPRVVGAANSRARDAATRLYRGAGVACHEVSTIEVAEASKLLENTFRLVNVALADEIADLCRRIGLSASEVINAAATKPFAFMPHYPGSGAGGTCIPTVPKLLLSLGRQEGVELPVIGAAAESNDQRADTIARYLAELLAKPGHAPSRRILVVGITYKPNYPDPRSSSALRLVERLQADYEVVVLDNVVDDKQLAQPLDLRRELNRNERFDAILVAVKHAGVDIDALQLLSPIVVDLPSGTVLDSTHPPRSVRRNPQPTPIAAPSQP